MLRKFRLPKIKNCLLEEYNQKALLGVSLFCFGSNASIWGLRISLLSFGFLYLISALLLVKKVDVSFAFAYFISKSCLEDQSHFFLGKICRQFHRLCPPCLFPFPPPATMHLRRRASSVLRGQILQWSRSTIADCSHLLHTAHSHLLYTTTIAAIICRRRSSKR